jgi:hypothetical protein
VSWWRKLHSYCNSTGEAADRSGLSQWERGGLCRTGLVGTIASCPTTHPGWFDIKTKKRRTGRRNDLGTELDWAGRCLTAPARPRVVPQDGVRGTIPSVLGVTGFEPVTSTV